MRRILLGSKPSSCKASITHWGLLPPVSFANRERFTSVPPPILHGTTRRRRPLTERTRCSNTREPTIHLILAVPSNRKILYPPDCRGQSWLSLLVINCGASQ